jgi:hypothetical protein
MTDLAAQALEHAQQLRTLTAGKASDQHTHVLVAELAELEALLRDLADAVPRAGNGRKKRGKSKLRRPLTSRSKLNRKPDKLRREFVRQYPCCNPNCRTPRSRVDWSHMGHKSDSGMAMKAPDEQTAPLCFHCHLGGIHTAGHVPGLTAEETDALHWRWIEQHREAWEEYQRKHRKAELQHKETF